MVCNPKHQDALVPSWRYTANCLCICCVDLHDTHLYLNSNFPFVDVSKVGQAGLRIVFIKIGEEKY